MTSTFWSDGPIPPYITSAIFRIASDIPAGQKRLIQNVLGEDDFLDEGKSEKKIEIGVQKRENKRKRAKKTSISVKAQGEEGVQMKVQVDNIKARSGSTSC